MADPTLESVAAFSDPSAWDKIVDNVPIFVPHRLKAKAGDGTEREIVVDEARLQRIADRINAKYRTTGVPIRLGEGHVTNPLSVAQKDQPRILAYGKDAVVGRWGPEGKLGILARAFVRKGCLPFAKELPFRSAEFYPTELTGKEDDLTGVALLRTDPRLDMGVVFFSNDQQLTAYSRPGGCICYATEDRDLLADGKSGDDEEVSDEDRKKFCRYMAACYPEAHKKYAAALSPTNGGLPTMDAKPKPEEPIRMQREEFDNMLRMQREQFEVERAKDKAVIADLTARVGKAEVTSLMVRYERDLKHLQVLGHEFDLAAEMNTVAPNAVPIPEDQFKRHLETVKRLSPVNYARPPIGETPIRLYNDEPQIAYVDDGKGNQVATVVGGSEADRGDPNNPMLKYAADREGIMAILYANPGMEWETAVAKFSEAKVKKAQ